MADRRQAGRWRIGKSANLECPLCLHPRDRHLDGFAQQTLNTMGCASCSMCEVNRQTLTHRDPGESFDIEAPSHPGSDVLPGEGQS